MKKSSEYKLKILYILKFLMEESDENEPLSTPAIIRKLENVGITAERKSIYDDIAALQRFGISIETKREGGRSGYYISERQFELPELKLLVDAVQSSKFITKQKSASLIKKLASLVSHKDAEALNRQVYVSNRTKT
ncbi:MAG: WYL domain-containing protein, partial [Clostridia bacterium]|nr:WYL domain-containing protein [Clostridia bacterium]